MILIKKQKEPDAWLRYRLTPNVDYQSIPELVEPLYKEQGYICAYCMRRIPHRDSVSNEGHRIEHMLSREKHDDKKLDYNNMVICCPGHIGTEDHCDKNKGSDDISFSLFDNVFINSLSYSNDGCIKSSNDIYDKELNDILNLNTALLKANRKSMIDELVKGIQSYVKRNGKLDKSFLCHMIEKYSSMYSKDEKQVYYPYCGVAIYYLQKKLNKL
ncbi:hypothetical protein E5358_07800 [Palleniella muris]|uniref:Uncharacterized protein n=1 Tax=Palleniella muris TaxID=3038145 RepID=A0AC61QQD0_9BACT|nr:hypothetical protein [Palleniella muris]TGX82198.1 hypothetical protein E5358_07800 [Palleniella muris]